MSRRLLAIVLAVVVAVVMVGGAAAYGLTRRSGPGDLTARASFADVEDLVVGAQVQMADVPIGSVTGITLVGDRARVTMAIARSARVPANVTAAVDQTTVLGENFIELQPPRSRSVHTALLADDGTITRTSTVPEAEQLVGAATQVFGSIPDSGLAQIIAAGGQGLSGEAANLHQLLNDLSTVAAGYAGRTGDVIAVINNLDQLGGTLASNSGADAQAITNLANTTGTLAQNAGQLNDLLSALDSLSTQGASLLGSYFPQLTDELGALRAVAEQLADHQQGLAGFLENLPLHNAALSESTVNDFLQILENLIVCGVPGGGGNESAASTTCAPTTGAGS